MKKKTYITLFIISIIFLGIGGTLAAITASGVATNITQIKSGNLTMTVDGGGNSNVSLMPASCTSEYAIKKTITASAKNTSGGRVSFSIGMNITTLGNDLKRDTMKYALTTSSTSCTDGLIASGNFADKTANSDVWLIKNDYDNITNTGNNYTKTYYLYIWLDSAETQNVTGSVSVTMKGSASNNPDLETEAFIDETGTLYYEIKSHADTTTQIDFSQTSEETNTNGIYTTTSTDSGNPVYYYRGNVDNHVIFANYCWRIIRTTESKGVKLIYDGVPMYGQCYNTVVDNIIGISRFNNSYTSPADVGYMYGTRYTYKDKSASSLSGSIIFGNNITYSNGTYTLTDTYTVSDMSNWSSEYSIVGSRYHYTCFTNGTTCTTVNYISENYTYGVVYFELTGGKNHLDILNEMLNNSSNTTNSTAKTSIDNWYQQNMTEYTSQLEDTVFCNDRSYNITGTVWDKDATNVLNYSSPNMLVFNGVKRLFTPFTTNTTPTLVCQNTNDKFTVSSSKGNGKLTYPVGMITADEVIYAGADGNYSGNSSYYLHNGFDNWVGSPYGFGDGSARGFFVISGGDLRDGIVDFSVGLRPVVSLKPGTTISDGIGTSTSPYIVDEYNGGGSSAVW